MLGVAQPFGLATPPFIIEPFFKSQSALMPLLLLSKSNPLRWASIWLSLTETADSVSSLVPRRSKVRFAPPLQTEAAVPGFGLVFGAWLRTTYR